MLAGPFGEHVSGNSNIIEVSPNLHIETMMNYGILFCIDSVEETTHCGTSVHDWLTRS